MEYLLGKGVGGWTANEDIEYSNLLGMNSQLDGLKDMAQRERDKAAALKDLEDRIAQEETIEELKLRISNIESASRVAQSDTANSSSTPTKFNYQPYLLYGGIGLVIIIGGFFIFPRK